MVVQQKHDWNMANIIYLMLFLINMAIIYVVLQDTSLILAIFECSEQTCAIHAIMPNYCVFNDNILYSLDSATNFLLENDDFPKCY